VDAVWGQQEEVGAEQRHLVLKNWVLIAVELKWLIDDKFQEVGGKIREAIHVFLFRIFGFETKQRPNDYSCVARSVNIVVHKQMYVTRLQAGLYFISEF